jgi:hypothetical protein
METNSETTNNSGITVEELILNDEDIIMPYIPDLDDSSEEDDLDAMRRKERLANESVAIEKRTKEELRRLYAHSLGILETIHVHNHQDRKV